MKLSYFLGGLIFAIVSFLSSLAVESIGLDVSGSFYAGLFVASVVWPIADFFGKEIADWWEDGD